VTAAAQAALRASLIPATSRTRYCATTRYAPSTPRRACPTCHRPHGRKGAGYTEENTQRLAQTERSGRTV
jgi:hypothetical protein